MSANLVTEVIVTDTNPIVQIHEYDLSITVNWFIGSRCNFDCSYCPDKWHDKTSSHWPIDKLQAAWKKILISNPKKDVKYHVFILGGEPTLNKDFLPFLKWLTSNFGHILADVGVITNGTASLKYYEEMINYCTWVTFSTHSEFMNEKKFFNTVIKIDQLAKLKNCMINVNIMDEPWHRDRNKEYQTFLTQQGIVSYIHPIYDYQENKPQFPVKVTNRMDLA
jgi:organic radical activating enzyme